MNSDLTKIAVEYGFRCAEKGWNLERTLYEAAALSSPAKGAEPVALDGMRRLTYFILKNADKFEWSLQGLGMLRLYLPGEARLHVWDTRYAFPGASPIHDHLQWGLTSTILSGGLTNFRYKEGSGKPYHWARFKAGYGAKQLHEAEVMLLQRQRGEQYLVGQTYSQEPNEIHETCADYGTVSLMQKRPSADGETARIFWPEGTEWGSAEPRPATAEEVKAITSYALERWSADAAPVPKAAPAVTPDAVGAWNRGRSGAVFDLTGMERSDLISMCMTYFMDGYREALALLDSLAPDGAEETK